MMQSFKEKMNDLRNKIEEADERSRQAKRKLGRMREIADQGEERRDALRRRIKLMEINLDNVEDRYEEAAEQLKSAKKKLEMEYKARRSLESREDENDLDMEHVEVRLKEQRKRMDFAEAKCEEAQRKLAMSDVEYQKINSRRKTAENSGKALSEQLKNVGRSIRQLTISEEKLGEREDGYQAEMRSLNERTKEEDLRLESAKRSEAKLDREVKDLNEEINTFWTAYNKIRRELEDTLNTLGDA